MKKFGLMSFMVLVFAAFSVNAFASEGEPDRFNLTSNVVGNILGLTNLEFSYRFAEHATIGLAGFNGKARISDSEVRGSSVGLIARYYLLPAFEKSSWYLAAGLEKKNYEVSKKENGIEYGGIMRNVALSAGGGYQWFWDSFNIGFGVLGTNQPDVPLIDESGNKSIDSMKTNLILDFTIGGKF